MRTLAARLALVVAATSGITPTGILGAQGAAAPAARHPLDATGWGVVYDVPATREVRVRRDVPYLHDARGTLSLDVYLPPARMGAAPRPVVVFLNAIGDQPGGHVKDWEIYRSWPRLVAAHGLAGISMDADPARIQESLRALFAFLAEHGRKYGIDGGRVGVYAASANVREAAAYLLGDGASASIRAAVLYYGSPPPARPRADLPVLFVVAESDVPRMRAPLDSLWSRVIEARAPWTLEFASGQPHAFDSFSDTPDARRIVQRTIAFWRSHLEPVAGAPREPDPARTILAAQYANDLPRATELLGRWVDARPRDTTALVQLAQLLVRQRRGDEAAPLLARALALDSTRGGALALLGQLRLGAERWEEAVSLLRSAVAHGFETSLVQGQLGFAQLHLRRDADAARSYERAFELGIPPGLPTQGVAAYNLAAAYARLGQPDRALAALGRSLDNGFADRAGLERDPDFATLRADPRFAALLERLAR